jgi:hypothetical protein
VVVPTSNHVTLTYGTSPIEYLGYALTALGLVLLFVLWRKGPVRYEPVAAGPVVWQDGQLVWHDEPSLDLPPAAEPEQDITADHERFDVLADQFFGPAGDVPGPSASGNGQGGTGAALPPPPPGSQVPRGPAGPGTVGGGAIPEA